MRPAYHPDGHRDGDPAWKTSASRCLCGESPFRAFPTRTKRIQPTKINPPPNPGRASSRCQREMRTIAGVIIVSRTSGACPILGTAIPYAVHNDTTLNIMRSGKYTSRRSVSQERGTGGSPVFDRNAGILPAMVLLIECYNLRLTPDFSHVFLSA